MGETCLLGTAIEDWLTLLILLARKILVLLFEQTFGGILQELLFPVDKGVLAGFVVLIV